MLGDFSKINTTKGKLPSLPFVRIKNDILKKGYSLSLVFVGKKKSQELNRTYRKKDKPTNILSFPYSKTEGEIIICPAIVKREAKKFDKSFHDFMGFLVIHGMLHLKGMKHSSKMEREEKKYDQKYFHRNRHRVINYKSCGRRISKGRKKS
ncbi:rRNA maturation RNase YbeY [Patescibacteria group bacterium]|nr:rRNA maturation RNase YbeY [Patescibacteria group bacterium]MBU1727831.1 rRNA maturation RNase YbeY [Patescibacteria group bacterium]